MRIFARPIRAEYIIYLIIHKFVVLREILRPNATAHLSPFTSHPSPLTWDELRREIGENEPPSQHDQSR